MAGRMSPDAAEIIPLVFSVGAKTRQITLPAMVTVTGPIPMSPPRRLRMFIDWMAAQFRERTSRVEQA